jgi:microsomal dipeptidase-like Zn-dependent dipeptidase
MHAMVACAIAPGIGGIPNVASVIADLHCHYPMHLLASAPEDPTLEQMVRVRRRPAWVDKLRASVLAIAARLLNFRSHSDTWRVDLEGLERGDVRLVLSVLYQPYAEMDLDEWPGSPPEDGYFADLRSQLDAVEDELRRLDPGGDRHVIARDVADLDGAGGRVAFAHCVEGAFHLGGRVADVERHVEELARRGVVYITLAHLFWRRVATNAPAIPFLPDAVYDRLFPQPGVGLTDLGRAAVRAMHGHGVLVDVSHMSERALDDTFAELDALDPALEVPVIASHGGFRFGRQEYMLREADVRRIAARRGVVGLILAQHQLCDGLRRGTKTFEQTVDVIRRHVDEIQRITGGFDAVAIGSDLDGFIKPTMSGVESAADLGRLREQLERLYGAQADAMLSGNAQRVVRAALSRRPGAAARSRRA